MANRYNMVENADFANTTSNMPNNWTTSGLTGSDVVLTTADSTNPVTNDDKRFIIYGTPGVRKYIEQSLNQSGAAGDAYVCGAWAKGASVALNSGPDRHFIVAVYFDYTDPACTDEWIHIRFSEDTQSWQYACGAAIAKYAYQNMIIRFQYRNNANM